MSNVETTTWSRWDGWRLADRDDTGGRAGSAQLGRGLAAAGVLMSADVHLTLYADGGFKDIAVVGPAFLLNAVAGLIIGLALLLWPHPIPLVLAVLFGLGTLTAFYLSATVGLFGVHETWTGTQVVTAEIAEWVAVLGGVLGLWARRRRQG